MLLPVATPVEGGHGHPPCPADPSEAWGFINLDLDYSTAATSVLLKSSPLKSNGSRNAFANA